MILAISMLGVAEAFTMGRNLGVDPQILFDIVHLLGPVLGYNLIGTGAVPTSPANGIFGQLTADMMLKDLRLSQMPRVIRRLTVMGGKAEELFASFVDGGNGAGFFRDHPHGRGRRKSLKYGASAAAALASARPTARCFARLLAGS